MPKSAKNISIKVVVATVVAGYVSIFPVHKNATKQVGFHCYLKEQLAFFRQQILPQHENVSLLHPPPPKFRNGGKISYMNFCPTVRELNAIKVLEISTFV